MDRYAARINLHGTTQRERYVNRLKQDILNKVPDNPSYKKVLLNGEETYLTIDSGTQTYYKRYRSLPGQEIYAGDYVEWANTHWLVTTCDFDDEIYRDGNLQQCNWLLKWQNDEGKIIERHAIVLTASKYNSGVFGNYTITIGDDQLIVQVPVDSETLKLRKAMGKKFFIDNNLDDPAAYELTGTGNVLSTYDGHGITDWIVKECAYTATEDDLKYGVCDYHSPTDLPEPLPPDETPILSAEISGNTKLKLGFKRTYAVSFKNSDGNEIDYSDFYWNTVSDFAVKQNIIENKIELLVDDEDYLDSSFLLQIINKTDLSVMSEIKITVIARF